MNRNIGVYLGAYGLSLLGNGIASVLFPLLVLLKAGDVLAAGTLASITAGVSAVVGVLAGVVVDRLNRKAISIVSDILSAASIALLPLVDALWGLNLAWFIALGVLGAFGDMPGMTARETLLPRLVQLDGGRTGALERIIGIREALSGALMVIGPGIGGLLIWAFGTGSAVLLITAGTSLAAAVLTCFMTGKAGEIEVPTAGSGGALSARRHPVIGVFTELVQGWRFLLHSRLVLAATLVTATLVAVIAGLQSTVLPAYFTAESLPQLSGFAATGIALGSLVGALIYTATSGRVRAGTWIGIGLIGSSLGLSVLGLLLSPGLVLAAAVLVGLANSPMSAVLGVATIAATPDALRGRVLGAQNALILAAPALTAAPLAAVATHHGLSAAGVAVAVLVVTAAAAALASRAFSGIDIMSSTRQTEAG